MSVGMNTLGSNDGVEGFECLGGKEDSGAEPTDVSGEMYKDVKFWFIEPTVGPACRTEEKMFNLCCQESLRVGQNLL